MGEEKRRGHSRQERLTEFMRRLEAAPAATNFDEAKACLDQTLNQVEDELTSIHYNPAAWDTDGRLYPPQEDNVRPVAGHPNVKRWRSFRHNTYIAVNGAIEITHLADGAESVVLSKPGQDGRSVWDT